MTFSPFRNLYILEKPSVLLQPEKPKFAQNQRDDLRKCRLNFDSYEFEF